MGSNCDRFKMFEGLYGPYFTPHVDESGNLSWTNNYGLPNPPTINIMGEPGTGLTISGQVDTVGELPASADDWTCYLVGTEVPYTVYTFNPNSGWMSLGQLASGPKGDPGAVYTPSVSAAGVITWTNNGDLPNPEGVNIKGPQGEDGVSPTVTVEEITGGHRVTIYDADHPLGQTFTVLDGDEGPEGQEGPAGPGVVSGGTTGQYLAKKSNTDYDTKWVDSPVFWATYGTTTSAQIEAAYQAGARILCIYSDRCYAMAYRTSATKHTLSVIYANTCYTVVCNNDSWSASNYPLAQSGNVPAKATNAPSDLGTAAIGSSSKYAAENHVHKMPSASDVGAIAAPVSPNDGDVLTYDSDSGEWVAEAGGGGGSVSPYTSNPAALGSASPGSSSNYARGDHVHPKPSAADLGITVPDAATSTPADLGTAAVGSSSKYAKEDHVHNMPTAANVGAIALPASPSSGDFLVYNGSAWAAVTMAEWQGGSY